MRLLEDFHLIWVDFLSHICTDMDRYLSTLIYEIPRARLGRRPSPPLTKISNSEVNDDEYFYRYVLHPSLATFLFFSRSSFCNACLRFQANFFSRFFADFSAALFGVTSFLLFAPFPSSSLV